MLENIHGEKNRIYILREKLGLSQEKFAEQLGRSKSSISLLESNKRRLTEHIEELICITFLVNKKWIQSGNGPMFLEGFDEAKHISSIKDSADNQSISSPQRVTLAEFFKPQIVKAYIGGNHASLCIGCSHSECCKSYHKDKKVYYCSIRANESCQ